MSVSGGTEKLQSILSVTYDDKGGHAAQHVEPVARRWLHTTFKPVKWLKLSERVSFEYSNGQGNVSTSHTGPILGAMWFPASASVYDRDAEGNLVYGDNGKPKYGGIASSADMEAGVTGPNIVNPVAQLETMRRRYPRTKVFSTTSLEIKPITEPDDQVRIHRRPRHARGGRILARNRRAGRLDDRNTRPVLLQ